MQKRNVNGLRTPTVSECIDCAIADANDRDYVPTKDVGASYKKAVVDFVELCRETDAYFHAYSEAVSYKTRRRIESLC